MQLPDKKQEKKKKKEKYSEIRNALRILYLWPKIGKKKKKAKENKRLLIFKLV